MIRRTRPLLAITTAAAVAVALAAGAPSGAAAKKHHPHPPAKPDKVVIIVVDALRKESVCKYAMENVESLMKKYVDTPRSSLGHTGSATVVTHNVITSGMLPKLGGWTDNV